MRRKTFPIWDEESACLQLPRNSRAVGLTKAIINGQLRPREQREPHTAAASVWNSEFRHYINRVGRKKGERSIHKELKSEISKMKYTSCCCGKAF